MDVCSNMLADYGLSTLSNSVLRRDLVTGEKINKMRKTYASYLSELGLPGRTEPPNKNKKTTKSADAEDDDVGNSWLQSNDFTNWYFMPDGQWEYEHHTQASLTNGFAGLQQLLPNALKFDKVPISRKDEKLYREIITRGEKDPSRGVYVQKGKLAATQESGRMNSSHPVASSPSNSAPTSNALGQSSNANLTSTNAGGAPAINRPSRHGTKRRYNDASFTGYGEGYADDDMADSTAGEDDGRGGIKKKRKLGGTSQGGSSTGIGGFPQQQRPGGVQVSR
jgi:hypothetical protein